jgi:hypothetical protein
LVVGVGVKCTSFAVLESLWNREVGHILVCIDVFLRPGRAPRLTEEADVAYPMSLVDLVEPSIQIFVLIGAFKPDAARMDSLALIPLKLELFADGVTVAVRIDELEDLDLVRGSIDAGEGEDDGGDELKNISMI